MGHGGGAYFAFNGFLLEVAEGDIAPNIPVQVNQDGVEATDGIEQLGDVVVGLDLGGVGVPAQAQAFYELLGIGFPVDLRVSGKVGVIVSDRTIDFAKQGCLANLLQLATQAVDHVGNFLAHGGWRGWLTVGAGQHRLGREIPCHFFQFADNAVHGRQQYLVTALFEHQAVGQVVNVFRGTGKVDEFGNLLQDRMAVGDGFEFFLDKIFHGFDVVVGRALNGFDSLGVRFAEVADNGVEKRLGGSVERRKDRKSTRLNSSHV